MADIFRTINTAGGNYSTLSAWEADTDYDLTASGTKEIGLISGQIRGDATAIQDATTNSSFYRVLTHASGNKHTGTSGDSIAQLYLATDTYMLDLFENFLQVSGIHFNGSGLGAFQCLAISNSGVVVDGCVFSFFKATGVQFRSNSSTRFTNNILYKIGRAALVTTATDNNYNISNNTLWNCGWANPGADDAIMYESTNATSYICNNVVVGSSGYFDWDATPPSSGNIVLSGNCSSDAFAPGFQKQSGLVAANVFVSPDYTPTPNLTIKSVNSALYNSGVSLSFAFTHDMSGTTRPQYTLWDVGAFEFFVSPFVETIRYRFSKNN